MEELNGNGHHSSVLNPQKSIIAETRGDASAGWRDESCSHPGEEPSVNEIPRADDPERYRCGLNRRTDDNILTLQKRLGVYKEMTLPIISFYQEILYKWIQI